MTRDVVVHHRRGDRQVPVVAGARGVQQALVVLDTRFTQHL